MKRLNISGWEKVVQGLDGQHFELQYGVDKTKCYRLSLKSVKTNYYYQMSIDKKLNTDGDYQVYLYNMNDNVTYPMTVSLDNLISKDRFTSYLDSIIGTADTGAFVGTSGNKTTQPN